MIKEFTSHPKPQNKIATGIFLITLFMSTAVFVISIYLEKYSGVIGLLALMLLVTSILIYTKYIAIDFYYDVMIDSEGVPLFVVRQITGRRQTTLCRIELADIVEIKKETKAERKAHETPKGVKKFFYTPTVSPEISYRIITHSRYERCEIVIEGTDELCDTLNSYSLEAKEIRRNYYDSDEEASED